MNVVRVTLSNLIIHHSDLFESSSHPMTFNLHYHRYLGPLSPRRVQRIDIDTSELVSRQVGDRQVTGGHFST
jgi:hypothetical protein